MMCSLLCNNIGVVLLTNPSLCGIIIPVAYTVRVITLSRSLYWSFIYTPVTFGRRLLPRSFSASLAMRCFLARRWLVWCFPCGRYKVLVAIAMVLVAEHYHSWWVLPYRRRIAREIISALRAKMDWRWVSSVAVSGLGEVKTTADVGMRSCCGVPVI